MSRTSGLSLQQCYAESEVVRIDFGTTMSITDKQTLPTGVFDTTFTIDTQIYGTTTVKAWGATNGHGTETIFFITSSIYLTSPTQGTVGTLVSITGCGYGRSETIAVTFGTNGTITIVSSNSGGMFAASFTVDTQPHAMSSTPIKGYGTASNQVAQSDFKIMPKIISVTPVSGTVGIIITIVGNGFSSSQSNNINLIFGSASSGTILPRASSNLHGIFTISFTVDTQVAGSTTINAIDTNAAETVSNYFKIVAQITQVTPTMGTVGRTVTVKGNGYGSGERVEVSFGNSATIATATTNGIGEFGTNFIVNSQCYGTTTIVGIGTATGEVATATFFIIPRLDVISPNNGFVGSQITMVGCGYEPSATIGVAFGITPTITQGQVNGNGTVTIAFTIDSQPYGSRTVTVYQDSDNNKNALNQVFIKSKIIDISPNSATVGTTITVSGTGYGVSEFIQFDFGKTPGIPLSQYTTSGMGTFTSTFVINTQVFGTTTVRVYAPPTFDLRHEYTSSLQIKGAIYQVAPTSGGVGRVVTIWGNGFGNAETVSVDFGISLNITSGMSDGDGKFSAVFTVDTQGFGTTTIVARGASANSAGNIFIIKGSITGLSPTQGTVGTTVTVKGDGFGASETIRISLGKNVTITTIISNSAGSFTTNFTVDVQSYGTKTVQAYGTFSNEDGTFSLTFNVDAEPLGTNTVIVRSKDSSVNDIGYFVVSSIIWVTPVSGTVGAFITVSGNGYAATEVIHLDFGIAGVYATTTANDNGSWQSIFTVDIQPYGTTTIKATGQGSGSAKECFFNILPRLTAISPSQGTVGSSITVDGNGYANGENIRIGFGKNATIHNILAGTNGMFHAVFTVDAQCYGEKTVKASGLIAGSDTALYTIMPNIVSVSPTTGTVGSEVMVIGNGFVTSQEIFVDFGTKICIKTPVSSIDGTFTTTFTIDTQSQGTKTIYAREYNNSPAGTISTFVINPNITQITSAAGTVGSSVTVTGNGYSATGNVYIYFGTTGVIGTTSANDVGIFTKEFTVNTQPYGSTTVMAKDMISLKQSMGTFMIKSNIWDVTPASGTVGTFVTIKGTGYVGVSNQNIRVDFGNTMTIAADGWTATIDGTFTATFYVNTQAYGTTTIIATYINDANQTAERLFTIQPALYKISPTSGTVGANVTVYGNGFVASDVVFVKFGQTTEIATATVETQGSFTATFTINAQPLGWTTITASGTMNTTATNTFKIIPKITLVSPGNGTVGTIVRVEGNGYQASENVSIQFGTQAGIVIVSAFGDGSFTTTFTVNTQKYGTTAITATGVSSSGSATNTFFIQPEVYRVSPNAGTVGTLITIAGSGFGANGTISVKFGETNITNKKASANGSWTTTFTIDTQIYGTTTIIASDITVPTATASNTLRILPYVRITPTNGSVGTSVVISGNGYGNGDAIHIRFGTIITAATITSGTDGSFICPYIVGLHTYGTTTVTATGLTTGAVERTTFDVVSAIVLVTPNEGIVTTTVTVTGNGFGASEQVAIGFGNKAGITLCSTDDYGSFTVAFTVDTQIYGTTTITASGTGFQPVATNTFRIQPEVYMVT
ncbi:hypothetical protein HY793_02250, partial [Candidatus Desantisbacteria bacterium]|nr:hypothetical protein [Candidatus Desantisbacteria bacterium]